MALLDLSSDLSRYRSEVSREAKTTPEASKATNNKNFATFQPITEKLSQYSIDVKKTQPQKLEEKLSSSKLDDVRKFAMQNLIINQVSKYSNINTTYDTTNINGVALEDVISKLGKINPQSFVSQLNVSNVLVNKLEIGNNNLSSPIDISQVERGTNNLLSPTNIVADERGTNNLMSPIDVNESVSGQNNLTSPLDIKPIPNDTSDNITNPDVLINKKPLSFDRKSQSVQINTNLLSPINNVINPDISLLSTNLTFDRVGQSPEIITDTIK